MSTETPRDICWDEHGGLYLPPEYAYIGVAMDRRDAAEEIERAGDKRSGDKSRHARADLRYAPFPPAATEEATR